MLTCEQTQHLFDAYLDGELSSSLRAEVHTHRLECSRCNHQLALLESCGDVVAGERKEPSLGKDFTNRVLSEMVPVAVQTGGGSARVYRLFAPLAAAAAAIVLTVLIAPPTQTERMVVSSAISKPLIDEQGNLGIVTRVQEEDPTGQMRTTGMYSKATVSLAEMMVQESLVPTVQGWDRIRLSNSALQELGRMVLLRSFEDLQQESEQGQDFVPARGPVEPAVPLLEPAIEQLDGQRDAEEPEESFPT